ncbi:threonine synthase [Halorutilales archaeon Cl-col2-1]
MSHVKGLRCRECGEEYPAVMKNTCESCFGPLEVEYDWSEVDVSREEIESGPNSIWRYADLLPIDNEDSVVDLGTGFNHLYEADNLADELGIGELYILNDSVNPSFSFKDRVTGVAVAKAIEFGVDAIGCASTGNLASSVAAHAAKADLPAYIFIPDTIEKGKITQTLTYDPEIVPVEGNYDDANRLATEVADENGWGFVNINLRPYYTEGSNTMAYEVAEQLGWEAPDHVVHPMAAGASLLSVQKGYKQLEKLGLIEDGDVKMSGSQPEGFPIAEAVRNDEPVKPIQEYETLAHSLAIGSPADGFYAKDAILESGGYAANPDDDAIIEGIKLLARTEGIFTEPAGGTTVAGLRQLAEEGRIDDDETVVVNITGNGLKAESTLSEFVTVPESISPSIGEFEDRKQRQKSKTKSKKEAVPGGDY